jgi:hypothetical protein
MPKFRTEINAAAAWRSSVANFINTWNFIPGRRSKPRGKYPYQMIQEWNKEAAEDARITKEQIYVKANATSIALGFRATLVGVLSSQPTATTAPLFNSFDAWANKYTSQPTLTKEGIDALLVWFNSVTSSIAFKAVDVTKKLR